MPSNNARTRLFIDFAGSHFTVASHRVGEILHFHVVKVKLYKTHAATTNTQPSAPNVSPPLLSSQTTPTYTTISIATACHSSSDQLYLSILPLGRRPIRCCRLNSPPASRRLVGAGGTNREVSYSLNLRCSILRYDDQDQVMLAVELAGKTLCQAPLQLGLKKTNLVNSEGDVVGQVYMKSIAMSPPEEEIDLTSDQPFSGNEKTNLDNSDISSSSNNNNNNEEEDLRLPKLNTEMLRRRFQQLFRRRSFDRPARRRFAGRSFGCPITAASDSSSDGDQPVLLPSDDDDDDLAAARDYQQQPPQQYAKHDRHRCDTDLINSEIERHSQGSVGQRVLCQLALIDAQLVARSLTDEAGLKVWRSMAKSVNVIDPASFPGNLPIVTNDNPPNLILLIGNDCLVNTFLQSLVLQLSMKPHELAEQVCLFYLPTYRNTPLFRRLACDERLGTQYQILFGEQSEWATCIDNGDPKSICSLICRHQFRPQTTASLHLSQLVISRGLESKLIAFLSQVNVYLKEEADNCRSTIQVDMWKHSNDKITVRGSSVECLANLDGDDQPEFTIRVLPKENKKLLVSRGSMKKHNVDQTHQASVPVGSSICSLAQTSPMAAGESSRELLVFKSVSKLICSCVKQQRRQLVVEVDGVMYSGLRFLQVTPQWHTHVDVIRFAVPIPAIVH